MDFWDSIWEATGISYLMELMKGRKEEKKIQKGQEPLHPTKEREESKYDFNGYLSVVPKTFIYLEQLEMFKTIITNFLYPHLNLDWLAPTGLTKSFMEKVEKFRTSSEYIIFTNFNKRPIKNEDEYSNDIFLLQRLLSYKGFEFDRDEIIRMKMLEDDRQGCSNFKKIISSSNTHTLRDYLENFVVLYKRMISVIRDFSKVYEMAAQNIFSQNKDFYNKLESISVDVGSLKDSESFTPGLEMNFNSENNARQFMLGIAIDATVLIIKLKRLLLENKIELKNDKGEHIGDRELIQMILDIRSAEIVDYDVKRSFLCEFKGPDNAFFSMDLINSNLESEHKGAVLNEMVRLFTKAGKIKDGNKFYQNLLDSESIMNTGIGQNIAIPNAPSDVRDNICVAVGISKKGIDFESFDRRLVKIIFMFTWNEEIFKNASPRIKILARLSRFLKDKPIREALKNAKSEEETFVILKENLAKLDNL